MPHSPRLRGDRVRLADAGTGEVGFVDVSGGAPVPGRFEAVCFQPGFLRGLAFCGPPGSAHGRWALTTLSPPREGGTFSGLPLDARLAVIDTATGEAPHWVRLDGVVGELFDVAVLPGVRRPAAIGFKGDEIRRVIDIRWRGARAAGPSSALPHPGPRRASGWEAGRRRRSDERVRGRHVEGEIVLWVVRRCCAHGESCRDRERMMGERGVRADHWAILRRTRRHAPGIERGLRWGWR